MNLLLRQFLNNWCDDILVANLPLLLSCFFQNAEEKTRNAAVIFVCHASISRVSRAWRFIIHADYALCRAGNRFAFNVVNNVIFISLSSRVK